MVQKDEVSKFFCPTRDLSSLGFTELQKGMSSPRVDGVHILFLEYPNEASSS